MSDNTNTDQQLPALLNFYFTKGDTLSKQITLKDLDVTSYDFVGKFIVGEVEEEITITKVTAASGIINMLITDTQTAELTIGQYYDYYLQWEDDAGAVRTFLAGKLIAKEKS